MSGGIGFGGITEIWVPPDGATGDVLTKASPADYDMVWEPDSGGGGSPGGSGFSTQYNNGGSFGGTGPGTTGQVLTSNGAGVAPTYQTPGASAFSLTNFIKNLGASRRSGTFDITGLASLTSGKNVFIMQTAQPIPSKGNAIDEFEMDAIVVIGFVFDATTIRCFWFASSTVVGDYAFAYQVSN